MSKHHCHATNCPNPVLPSMFMCKRHWFQLPKEMRDKILDNYRRGQEKDKTPSREWIKAAFEARIWLAQKEKTEREREALADTLFSEFFVDGLLKD